VSSRDVEDRKSAMAKEKRIVRMAKKGKPIRQVAAIPFRLNDDGNIEVLLITSNTTKRFIVPKGWPMKGKGGKRTARIEAEEEAGVTGKMLKTPLGTYEYWKRLTTRFVNIKVTVYLLAVADTLPSWKESARRHRAWLSPANAATLIDEPELASLMLAIDTKVRPA
jgi:8-oxo-dGTP pyrophosphatase MutT (NUDIX family)